MRNRCTYAERKELQYQQRYSRFSLSDSSATTDDDCQRAGGREGKSVFLRNGEKEEESARGWRERDAPNGERRRGMPFSGRGRTRVCIRKINVCLCDSNATVHFEFNISKGWIN